MGVASDTYAQLNREMYDDWLTRYYPKQKELLEKTQDGSLLNEQLGRVDENFKSAQQASEIGLNHKMERYGVTSEQDDSSNAKLGLANVTSKNSLRDYEKERAMSTLNGSSSGLLQKIKEK